MSKFELNLTNYLVLSIPIFLITGPFLSDLALSLSSLIFLIFTIRKKKFEIFKDKYFIIFIIFYLLILISVFLSKYSNEILIKNIFYFRFGIFILVIKYLIYTKNNFIENISKVIVTLFVLLFIDSSVQFIFGKNILGFSHPPGRITSFFGDESVMGSYISRLLPLLIALLYIRKVKDYKIFLLIFMSLILVVLSGERTSVALYLLFILLFFFVSHYNLKKKILSFSLLLFLGFSIILILVKNNEYVKFRIIDSTLSQINFNYKNNEPYYKEIEINGKWFALARNDTFLPLQYHLYYDASKQIFFDNFIFGSGPKTYRYVSSEEKYLIKKNHAAFEAKNLPEDFHYDGYTNLKSSGTHPHNIYLQLFSETGVIGGLYIFFIFLYAAILMFLKITYIKKILLISLFINLFPFITSGNFFNNWLSIIYFLPLGFLYIDKNLINKYESKYSKYI